MKRILSSFLLFFLISLFGVVAQEKNYNEQFVCLDMKYSPDAGVASIGEGDARYQRYTHSAVINIKESEKPLPNAQTYVIECLSVTAAMQDDPGFSLPDSVRQEIDGLGNPTEICTTGNSATDNYVYGEGNDRLGVIKRLYSRYDRRFGNYMGYHPDGYYQFDYVTKREPENSQYYFTTDSNSQIVGGPFAYVNYITGPNERKFLGYNRFDKLPPVDDGSGLGALQQNDLQNWTFEAAQKRCVPIAWDPYGVIFDSQTLEPIAGATVILLVKDGATFRKMTSNDMPGKYILNPMITREDGRFSFIVPDGTYKLSVEKNGYIYPSTIKTLHANAQKIYSDFYYGNDIVQSGKMQHRDVPLDSPFADTSAQTEVKLISVFQTLVSPNETNVDGRVSLPFARVNSYCKDGQGVRGTQNTSVQADKSGVFSLTFDALLCDLEKGETYGMIEVEKIDLTGSLNNPKIPEKKKKSFPTYSYNPILSHIEGYSLDTNNKVIANAEVGVYILGDKNPQFTVKADKTGRFILTSDQLPKSSYELRYKDALKKITRVSTTKFVAQNIETIRKEKINLYFRAGDELKMTSKSVKILSSERRQQNLLPSDKYSTRQSQENAVQEQKKATAAHNQIIMMLAIMGFIVVGGGITAFLIIKGKKSPQTL